MKTLAGILLFVLLGVVTNAQSQSSGAKLIAETSAMSEKIVKGAPFSADAVNESVQVLADGNRIARSTTNKLYRNSEGRFRREISGGSGGSLGSFYTVGPGVTILDPIGGYRYLLDSELRTARVGLLGTKIVGAVPAVPGVAPKPAPAPDAFVIEKRREIEKHQSELNATTTAALALKEKAYADVVKVYGEAFGGGQNGAFVYAPGKNSRYESKTEDLGVQSIEGVEATGIRTTTTIPAGDIGNERPIEIVYERWYSKELQLVVMSKHYDPRFGEQTYRLTNIVRSEPDPSLFELPSGYKVLSEPAATYKISTSQGGGQNVIYTKAPSGATTVKAGKP